MRRERGGAGAAIFVILALLAGAGYYFFVHKVEPAESVAADEEVAEEVDQAEGDDTESEEESGEVPLHKVIKDNYGKKLQKRMVDVPE